MNRSQPGDGDNDRGDNDRWDATSRGHPRPRESLGEYPRGRELHDLAGMSWIAVDGVSVGGESASPSGPRRPGGVAADALTRGEATT